MHGSITDCALNILIGGSYIKHLWYLPALFWIFLIMWTLGHFKVNVYLSFAVSIILAILCSMLQIELQYFCIGNAIQYLPYFILGTWLYKNQEIGNMKRLILGGGLFVIFALGQKITDIAILDNLLRILLPCSIIFTLMQMARMAMTISQRIPGLSFILKNSFAIYLFHVIIIFAMYIYRSSFTYYRYDSVNFYSNNNR